MSVYAFTQAVESLELPWPAPSLSLVPSLAFNTSPAGSSVNVLCLVAVVLIGIHLLDYSIHVFKHHHDHQTKQKGQLPPVYPSIIPLLGNAIPFIWDNEGFFYRVT